MTDDLPVLLVHGWSVRAHHAPTGERFSLFIDSEHYQVIALNPRSDGAYTLLHAEADPRAWARRQHWILEGIEEE